jgi:WD40 repeat protein
MCGNAGPFERSHHAQERCSARMCWGHVRVGRVGSLLVFLSFGGVCALAWLAEAPAPTKVHVAWGRVGVNTIEASVSPTGEAMATVDSNGRVALRFATLDWQISRVLEYAGRARAAAISSQGRLIAHGGPEPGVILWNVKLGGSFRRLPVPVRHVRALAFCPLGRRLAVASQMDGRIALWDISTGRAEILRGRGPGVLCLAFSPDGRSLVTGTRNGSIILWDLETGWPRFTLGEAKGPVASVSFCPDGRLVAAGNTTSGEVTIWAADTGRIRVRLGRHSYGALSVAFSQDGQMLASAGGDGMIRLWAISSGLQVAALDAASTFPNKLAFLPDRLTLLATGTSDNHVRIWNLGQDIRLAASPP